MKSALRAGPPSRAPVALRRVGWLALAVAGAVAAPAACFYPSYSFDLPDSGSAGATTTGPGGGSTTSTSTSMTGHVSSTSAGGSGGQGGAAMGGHGGQGGSSTTTTTSTSTSGGMDGGSDAESDAPVDTGSDAPVDAGSCITADCSNAACAPHYGCVDTVPGGWTGYVAIYDGPGAGDPGCPAAFPANVDPPYLGNDGFSAMPASCTACACGGPTGETCVLPTAIATEDGQCGKFAGCGGVLDMPANWNGACTGVDELPGGAMGSTCGKTADGGVTNCMNGVDPCNVSMSTAAPAVTGGVCAPSGGAATVPPVAWANLARACGDPETTAPGCNGGQVCLPKPSAPFVGAVCIFQAGDAASCPPGAFSTKHVFYQGDTDDRACSPCACGAAGGATCGATISVYGDPTQATCDTLVTSFPAGTCVNLNGNPTLGSRKASVTQGPTGGACPPSGGQPTGTAAPATPTTFCCAG